MDRDALALDARRIFDAATRAVQAPALLHQVDLGDLLGRPPDTFERVLVVGAGKASIPFAGALEARLGEVALVEGTVVVPAGVPRTVPDGMPRPTRIRVVEGGHPVPTAAGMQTAADALALAQSAGPDDLVVALISGGGSALWTLPPAGVSLDDLRATTRLLLASGVPIEGTNTVRKHLSRLSGGRLALAAAPATLLALVLSDVVGDDPAVIASGPTVPDPTSFADAVAVLDAASLTDRVPQSVRAHLSAGSAGTVPETPGPDHPAFRTATTVVIGTNGTALAAAAAEAARLGMAEGALASAEAEAQSLYARLLVEGWLHTLDYATGEAQAFEQIAYDLRPAAVGLVRLYEATGDERYAVMAGLAAAWFHGLNPAGATMADPATGRGYDGILSPTQINANAGAESTVEAQMTLLAVAQHPEAAAWAWATADAPRTLTWQGHTVRARTFSGASTAASGPRVAIVVLDPEADASHLFVGPEAERFLASATPSP